MRQHRRPLSRSPRRLKHPLPCTIAFDTDRDGNREVYTMAPDGSGLVNLTSSPGEDFDPAWSPDGSRIAFVSNRANGQEDGQFIYVMNADGSGVRQLTYENWSDWPDWSHDGSQLTYTSNDDIYVIKADGSGQSVNLTSSPEKDNRSTWSPDGSQIAWLSDDGKGANIFVMNTDGGNIQQVTDNGQAHNVQWTVDGRLFTGWGWKDREQFCFNCLVDPDGENITDAGGKGELRRYFPFWTLEGERVECVSANFNNEPASEIYLVGEIYPDMFLNLTNNPADDANPDWPAKCGQQPIVLGYAGDDPSQPQRKAGFLQACEELGLLCVDGSVADLAARPVSAIILNTVNGEVLEDPQAIRGAIAQGIPLFVLDAEPDLEGVYSVTVDQRSWVEVGLAWMFERMGGQGEFAYFDVYPAYGHAAAIDELLSRYPGIKLVERGAGPDFDPFWVKPMTADFVKNNPGLGAVWTNANMEGAIQGVVEESGAPQDQWPLLMCEASAKGLETWKSVRGSHPGLDCIAVGSPPGIAWDAVHAAYLLLSGASLDPSALAGPYGRSLYVEFPVVTAADLQQWLDTNPSMDLRMTPEQIRETWFLD
jgi:ABC-type sugar transport system substrate-binding protein